MCTGSKTSNPLKNPLYWLVKQDSRAASELGRGLGWDYLRDEGKKNQENPGRAIGKAATVAATWYLGGLLGGAGGAGSGGISASGNAGVGAGNAAGGLSGAGSGALGSGAASAGMAGLEGTMESALANTGYTPSSLLNAIQNGPGSGQGMLETMGNYGKGLLSKPQTKRFAMRYGANQMMQPQQTQQAQPMQFQQPQEQQQQPIYGFDPSLLTEEEKQRLRMLGFPV